MDKKISFLVLLGVLVAPAMAMAQLHGYGEGVDIKTLIRGVEMAAGLIFGAIAVISFLVAGVLFLAAQGEPAKLQQARQAVIWGVAGVAIGIIAFSIIAIVGNIIGG